MCVAASGERKGCSSPPPLTPSAPPQIRVDRPVLELAQARRTLRIRAHSSPELEVWRVGLSRNAAACSSVNYMRLSDVMIGDEVCPLAASPGPTVPPHSLYPSLAGARRRHAHDQGLPPRLRSGEGGADVHVDLPLRLALHGVAVGGTDPAAQPAIAIAAGA